MEQDNQFIACGALQLYIIANGYRYIAISDPESSCSRLEILCPLSLAASFVPRILPFTVHHDRAESSRPASLSCHSAGDRPVKL